MRSFARVFPIGQPYLAYYEGRVAWLRGHPREARRAWRVALTAARRLTMPYEQGLIHYELGRHRAPGDPARAAHLSRAAALFHRLGAISDLARVAAAQESLAPGHPPVAAVPTPPWRLRWEETRMADTVASVVDQFRYPVLASRTRLGLRR